MLFLWLRYPQPQYNNFYCLLPSATKLRRLCFYTCVSVHGGGSASVHAGLPLSGAGTPGEQVPHPQEQAPPPRSAYGNCCGRYASYWNAFLLCMKMSGWKKSHHWNGDRRWRPLPIVILAVAWTQAQVVNLNPYSTGKETVVKILKTKI